jgi:hypothetical protein
MCYFQLGTAKVAKKLQADGYHSLHIFRRASLLVVWAEVGIEAVEVILEKRFRRLGYSLTQFVFVP